MEWLTDSQLNEYYKYWVCEDGDLKLLLNTMWSEAHVSEHMAHFARLPWTTP